MAALEVKSTKRFLPFGEEAVSFMQEQVQSGEHQLCNAEAERVAAEVAHVAVESNLQSPTASESASSGEFAQLTCCVAAPGDEVTRLRQECDHKVESVIFERDWL